MTECRYSQFTYLEIKEKAKGDFTIVIPTGCTEQQGPHLTVDFDTWFAETLMVESVIKAMDNYNFKGIVIPTLPFGPTPEHKNYLHGYIHLPQEIFEQVLHSVVLSLIEQGFKRFVIWRGCGGHQVNRVINRITREYGDTIQIFNPSHPFYNVWCKVADPSIPGGHADSFTTSISLYKRPETVRENLISNPNSNEPEWEDGNLDFSKYSKTGVIGDPTKASKELGRKLWEETVNQVIEILKDLS